MKKKIISVFLAFSLFFISNNLISFAKENTKKYETIVQNYFKNNEKLKEFVIRFYKKDSSNYNEIVKNLVSYSVFNELVDFDKISKKDMHITTNLSYYDSLNVIYRINFDVKNKNINDELKIIKPKYAKKMRKRSGDEKIVDEIKKVKFDFEKNKEELLDFCKSKLKKLENLRQDFSTNSNNKDFLANKNLLLENFKNQVKKNFGCYFADTKLLLKEVFFEEKLDKDKEFIIKNNKVFVKKIINSLDREILLEKKAIKILKKVKKIDFDRTLKNIETFHLNNFHKNRFGFIIISPKSFVTSALKEEWDFAYKNQLISDENYIVKRLYFAMLVYYVNSLIYKTKEGKEMFHKFEQINKKYCKKMKIEKKDIAPSNSYKNLHKNLHKEIYTGDVEDVRLEVSYKEYYKFFKKVLEDKSFTQKFNRFINSEQNLEKFKKEYKEHIKKCSTMFNSNEDEKDLNQLIEKVKKEKKDQIKYFKESLDKDNKKLKENIPKPEKLEVERSINNLKEQIDECEKILKDENELKKAALSLKKDDLYSKEYKKEKNKNFDIFVDKITLRDLNFVKNQFEPSCLTTYYEEAN